MAEKRQFTQLQFGFDIRTGSPVDRRMILTKEEMTEGKVIWNEMEIILDNILPPEYVALCSDNGKLYIYDKERTEETKDPIVLGKFKMLSNLIDVVDSEGNSLTDATTGLVTLYDPDGTRIKKTEDRLEQAEKDIEDLDRSKVDSEDVEEVVDSKLEKYQRRTLLRGDADVFDSDGNPVPASDSEGNPVYGVHVKLTKHDTEPWKEVITHEEVVPKGGWVSKYAVGGVAIGQAFVAGTKIEEVLRQLFEGDPRTDNVVCYNWNSNVPEFWTDIPWRQETYTRKQLHDDGVKLEFKPNNQYILMALPRAMLEEYDGDGIKPVKLSEVYNTDRPEFTYKVSKLEIKNSSVAEDWGYMVYYLPNKVTGTQRLTFEFKYFDE